jgi:hypothetical protein
VKITFYWHPPPAVSDLAEDIEHTMSTQLSHAAAQYGVAAEELLVMLTAASPFHSLEALVLDQKLRVRIRGHVFSNAP